MEKIASFEDALSSLGESHPYVREWREAGFAGANTPTIQAFLKLRVVCTALNDGWRPQFTRGEEKWYPWFWFYRKDELDELNRHHHKLVRLDDYDTEFAGLAYIFSNKAPSAASGPFSSCLFLKSEALAEYCGKQFIDLWADYSLIHKSLSK